MHIHVSIAEVLINEDLQKSHNVDGRLAYPNGQVRAAIVDRNGRNTATGGDLIIRGYRIPKSCVDLIGKATNIEYVLPRRLVDQALHGRGRACARINLEIGCGRVARASTGVNSIHIATSDSLLIIIGIGASGECDCGRRDEDRNVRARWRRTTFHAQAIWKNAAAVCQSEALSDYTAINRKYPGVPNRSIPSNASPDEAIPGSGSGLQIRDDPWLHAAWCRWNGIAARRNHSRIGRIESLGRSRSAHGVCGSGPKTREKRGQAGALHLHDHRWINRKRLGQTGTVRTAAGGASR